jgi:GxxExxY protein
LHGGFFVALLYPELSYQIRGSLYEVYNALGPGFREETYKVATCTEIAQRGINVSREVDIEVIYKGTSIDRYRLDIVVDARVVLELKAVEELHPRHAAQLLAYLKASQLRLGMLVNFGGDKIVIERIIN